MSRRKQRRPPSIVADSDSLPDSLTADPIVEAPAVPTNLEPAYPCPICWPRFGGVGLVRSSSGATVYCKCSKCPHSWTTTRKEGQLVNVLKREEEDTVPKLASPGNVIQKPLDKEGIWR